MNHAIACTQSSWWTVLLLAVEIVDEPCSCLHSEQLMNNAFACSRNSWRTMLLLPVRSVDEQCFCLQSEQLMNSAFVCSRTSWWIVPWWSLGLPTPMRWTRTTGSRGWASCPTNSRRAVNTGQTRCSSCSRTSSRPQHLGPPGPRNGPLGPRRLISHCVCKPVSVSYKSVSNLYHLSYGYTQEDAGENYVWMSLLFRSAIQWMRCCAEPCLITALHNLFIMEHFGQLDS